MNGGGIGAAVYCDGCERVVWISAEQEWECDCGTTKAPPAGRLRADAGGIWVAPDEADES